MTDYFKMDINIAYSIINMKLRDKYSNLDELCSVENIDTDKLIAHFNRYGYIYDITQNRFLLK
ncbi:MULTISPECIES: DUF4250 domain-containing protein [Fusobacterium]|uniref:DUF4250 domain-containing protein n=1 Tax=Fusobacterium TaxID=848 RepID=UPI001FCB899B|nr:MULTISPECIES: DUF4250 domain-containing protein [Fusobacterium]